MVLVDGARIRRQIKREYEKVRCDLHKAQEQLDRFQKEDLPHFSRWMNSRFGALLTELRETNQRLQELQRLLLEIESEMLFSGLSPGRAYARVMNRRKNPEPQSEQSSGDEEDPFGDRRGGQGSGSSRDEHSFESDEFFGSGNRRKSGRAKPNASSSLIGRVKELYRALARRLHPDAQKEMTAQKREWWHQAQAAYENGDVEQLEIILSLCEIDEAGTSDKTSLSVLQRISAGLKKTLRQMKAQIAKHRRDPAWNFAARTDTIALAVTMRRQLNYDLRSLKEQLHAMELQISCWTSKAQGRRSRPSRPFVADPFESYF